jgi:hypothetical protein
MAFVTGKFRLDVLARGSNGKLYGLSWRAIAHDDPPQVGEGRHHDLIKRIRALQPLTCRALTLTRGGA